MDKLFIRQLKVPAVIGTLPEERLKPQPIVIDLEFALDIAEASVSDQLNKTIDYSAVYRCVRDYVSSSQFQLIETLAARVADELMGLFPISWLRLSVTKFPVDLSDAKEVGIVIERSAIAT